MRRITSNGPGPEVSNKLPKIEGNPVYPNEWFKNPANEGKKPPLIIPKKADVELSILRKWVYSGIRSHTLLPTVVRAYLYAVISEFKCRLARPWTSFGRKIGDIGQDVGLSDVFSIVFDNDDGNSLDGKEKPEDQSTSEKKDDLWMCIYLCLGYRVATCGHAEYASRICDIGTNILKAQKAPDHVDAHYLIEMGKIWIQDINFTALIAGIDMYFCMFKKHYFSLVKVGTLTTRFKDCTTLAGLLYMNKITKLNNSEISKWIWLKYLADDLQELTEDGNEYDELDSYMPYFTSLLLSDKSPYSATEHENIHLYIHIIGAIVGSTRSKNAIVVGNPGYGTVCLTAMVFGYALSTVLDIKAQYSETGDITEYDRNEEEEELRQKNRKARLAARSKELAEKKKIREQKRKDLMDKNKNGAGLELTELFEMSEDEATDDEEEMEEKKRDERLKKEKEERASKEPKKLDGYEWYKYIRDNDNRLTKEMMDKLTKIFAKFGGSRIGTVGAYLYNYMSSTEQNKINKKKK